MLFYISYLFLTQRIVFFPKNFGRRSGSCITNSSLGDNNWRGEFKRAPY